MYWDIVTVLFKSIAIAVGLPRSFRLQADFVDDFSPLLELRPQISGRLLRGATFSVHAHVAHTLGDLDVSERGVHFAVHPLNHLDRRSRRRHHREPADEVKARQGFGNGRYAFETWQALERTHAQRTQLPLLHERRGRRYCEHDE